MRERSAGGRRCIARPDPDDKTVVFNGCQDPELKFDPVALAASPSELNGIELERPKLPPWCANVRSTVPKKGRDDTLVEAPQIVCRFESISTYLHARLSCCPQRFMEEIIAQIDDLLDAVRINLYPELRTERRDTALVVESQDVV